MPSLFFEDLRVGDSWTSQGRTLTEADVVAFAGLSGDFNPIHLDVIASAGGPFGKRVVFGILGLAVVTGMIDRLGLFRESMAGMLAIKEWIFPAPIFIGDTVHLELSIESVRLTSGRDRGVVDRRIKLVNQQGVVTQEGVVTVMVLTRESPSRVGGVTA